MVGHRCGLAPAFHDYSPRSAISDEIRKMELQVSAHYYFDDKLGIERSTTVLS